MAGRIQLATTGPQDQFFTSDPEYTHFKENFRKHSNFSVEFVDVAADQVVDFGKTLRFRLPNNAGDLVRTMSLKFTLPALNQTNVGYIESVGHALIERVDFLVGGQMVQRVTSDWLQLYSEHYFTQTKQNALYHVVGKYPVRTAGTRSNDSSILGYLGPSTADVEFYVDVPFYFYREPTLAFPLCTVCNQQEVEVEVQLRKLEDLVVDVSDGSLPVLTETHAIKDFTLQCEMVFLDAVEKIKFQKTSKDYLIVQNQQNNFFIPRGERIAKFKLNFTNPVKELYFVIQSKGARVFDYDNYRQTTEEGKLVLYEHLDYLTLTLDGEEVLTNKTGRAVFLKAVQAGIHHAKTQLIRRFYSYSFALEPEKHAPTGHVNFSVIKDQLLELHLHTNTLQDRDVRVYARAYNVLRVREGKASVIFNVQY
jgi:hypothetical protein